VRRDLTVPARILPKVADHNLPKYVRVRAIASRARKQAMPDRPKITPLRSWLVASRARKQAMPDQRAETLPQTQSQSQTL